ncbi:MAG TPA: dihydrodipicolinate synthase family protein [Terracidiphilus sp.]|jgi:dihydrodipicolinate synthase/N-acetylneuraminate lyase|nr:dihydrodipicolinate synthase family protein [Terracidiphilus sp.]
MLIEGIFAAATTPFYSDERVYYRKIEANIARYSRSLLSGMVVLGSTGEAVALDDEETHEVLRTAAEAAAPEKVLVAGVGRESAKATVELAEVAAKHQYDVALVRMPTYYHPLVSPEVALNYFNSVADRSPLPVLLYNIPKFVPYNLPVEVVAELAQHPNIIGIKDSTGDLARVKALIELTRKAPTRTTAVTTVFEAVTTRMLKVSSKEAEQATFVSVGDLAGGTAIASVPPKAAIKTRSREVGFQVLTGAAGIVLDTLEAGGAGSILGFAACAPQACHEVYSAWKDHDLALAHEKQKRVAHPAKRIVGELGISGVKYACDFNGYYGGRARLPLLPVSSHVKAEIESLLTAIRN